MAANPHVGDVPHFERALRSRLAALRTRIAAVLEQIDTESYGRLVEQIHDVDDEAFADLIVDVRLADLSREVEEVRAIDAALQRILTGTFGTCVDCGEPIERHRLEAHPTAVRCLECQRARERTPSPSGLTRL